MVILSKFSTYPHPGFHSEPAFPAQGGWGATSVCVCGTACSQNPIGARGLEIVFS